MSQTSMTGNDTLILNNYVYTGQADAKIAELTFPNEIASVKTGKSGNSIYGLNESGKQADLTLRLLRACADDAFTNNMLINQLSNFAGYVLIAGQFIKKVGDGKGNITSDIYDLSGGVFVKQVDAFTSTEGDTEQSVVIYKLKFSAAPRSIT